MLAIRGVSWRESTRQCATMPAIVALFICDVLVTLNAFIAQGEVESLARLCLACKTLYDPVSLWELRTEAEIDWHDCEVWFE